jgi:hypothetical protein
MRHALWAAAAGVGIVLGGTPAPAELLGPRGPVKMIAVGAVCGSPPGRPVEAPLARGGSIDLYDEPAQYVTTGDVLSASPGLGFGLRAQPVGLRPGDIVTVRIDYPDGSSSIFDLPLDDLGEVEVLAFPDSLAVMQGFYLFGITHRGKPVLTYEITVASEDMPGPCVAETS